MVAGGFALLATTGAISGTLGLAPVLGLGLVAGAGGMGLMAISECGGPLRCISASNQCCGILLTRRGLRCPRSC